MKEQEDPRFHNVPYVAPLLESLELSKGDRE